MRLHRLQLAAIGPFATAQDVDFDELGAGGLFLLDGPTGAGKSTVLDAITFALYGPGKHGGDGRLHSDFAEAATEPFVTLEFSLRGVRHRITRTPEFERPKRRGDGVTVQHATAHLQRWEGERWVSRSSNKAEIGELLDEAIGLTREQFNQVVLLPQGEFATFLRANDDERRDVLSRLFGTELFQRVTDELELRRQAAMRELSVAADRVRSSLAAAGEAAGLDSAQREDLCSLNGADCRLRLVELRAELFEQVAGRRAEAARLTHEESVARANAEQASAVAGRLQRFVALQAEAIARDGDRSLVQANRGAIADAVRAEPVRALVQAAQEAAAEVARAADALVAVRVSGYDDDVATIVAAATARAERAAQLQHIVDLEVSFPAVQRSSARAGQELAAALSAEQQCIARLNALPALIASADEAATAAPRRAILNDQLAAVRRAEIIHLQLAELRAAGAQAVVAHQQAVDQHQRLVDARLTGMAAELAGQLSDGEPCAVCGSADHPAPARPAGESVNATQLRAAQRARADTEACRRAAETELAERERELAVHTALAGNQNAADLETELAELTAVLAGEADPADTAVAPARLRAEQDQLQGTFAAAAAKTATARAASDTAQAEQGRLTALFATAAQHAASVAARQRELTTEATALSAYANALREYEDVDRVHVNAIERAEAEAQVAGFASLDTATAAVLDSAERDALARTVERWELRERQVNAELAAAEFAGLAALASNEVTAALQDAIQSSQRGDHALAATAQARGTAEAAFARARHAADRFTDREADLASELAAQAALTAEVEPVVHLARLARGMAGNRRVALTTYVLRHWFGHVVDAANVRLRSISSGRYELLRVDEGETKNERAGLTLNVVDAHTGEARSPRSLSGGETFYTSLALALGLADVVKAEAGGANLDTLFIDEGFGSLDLDTLAQVMDVIDDLRDGGRVVGVVSHVAELKERIPERLEVRRLPDGSSALRVVA